MGIEQDCDIFAFGGDFVVQNQRLKVIFQGWELKEPVQYKFKEFPYYETRKNEALFREYVKACEQVMVMMVTMKMAIMMMVMPVMATARLVMVMAMMVRVMIVMAMMTRTGLTLNCLRALRAGLPPTRTQQASELPASDLVSTRPATLMFMATTLSKRSDSSLYSPGWDV